MKKSVELRAQKKAIWDQANELTAKIDSGTGQLSPEERTKWEQMNKDMNALDVQIKDAEIIEARSLEFAKNANENGDTKKIKSKEEEKRSYEEHFMQVFRGSGLDKHEARALNQDYYLGVKHRVEHRAATDPQSAIPATNPELGGYLVPETWAQSIEKEMQVYGEVLGAVSTFTTTQGGIINFPYQSDFSKGKIIAENTAATVNNVEWATKSIGAYKYTSDQIVVPYELFQDAAYDIAAEVTAKTAERIGRIVAEHVTKGTGSGQPTGILTAATASGKTTAVSGSIDVTAVTNLEHSVDRAYRNKANARFMFHDDVLEALKLLTIGSADDRPLWRMSTREGEADTINGYRYVVNNEMPTFGTTNKIMAFGDFSKYRLRQDRKSVV